MLQDEVSASHSRVKQKRKLSAVDQEDSGIPEKIARYDTVENQDVKDGRTPDKCLSRDTSQTTLDSSLFSSGYGSGNDFQSPNDTRDVKWRFAESSPADSAFAISPNPPASNMAIGGPTSVGYSSGIESGTPDMRSVQSSTSVSILNPEEHIPKFLCKNFVNLKDNLEPTVAADQLYTDKIISTRDIEIITEETRRTDKCDFLIKAIANSKRLSDTTSLRKLQAAMEMAGGGHLVADLFKEDEKQDDVKSKNNSWKTHDIKSQFHAHGDKMKEEVDPKLFIDELVVKGVLSLSDHDYIAKTNHREDAVVNLIRYVVKKPANSFVPFCSALGDHYPEIARLLQNPSTTTGKDSTRSTLTGILKAKSVTFSHDMNGETSITQVKINLQGENKDVEKMIVDDYVENPNERLEEEAMDVGGFVVTGVHFSSIRIDLTGRSCYSQLRFIKRITKNPSYMQKWLQCAISQKYLQILSVSEAKSVSVEIHAKWPDCSTLPCKCRLKAEAIVKHYTYIERELKCIGTIVRAFKECSAFDEDTKQTFKSLNDEETDQSKNELFLRKVLNCKKTQCLCLFEKQLRETGQKHILEKLLASEDQRTVAEKKIKTRHIRKNMNYLLEEIEPMMFVNELRALPRSDAIVEVMLSKELRRNKCRQFLEFIIKEGKPATEWFVDVLQTKNMTAILRILHSCVETEGSEDYSEGIAANYKTIVNDIDARALRQTFVDQKEIQARHFDRVMKHASRKERVIWLVKHVLKRKKSVQRCFVDALQIHGYADLANTIRSEKDQYRECPRLSALLNQGNAVTIKAEFDIAIEKGDATESPLQTLLHKSLFSPRLQSSEDILSKTEYTRRWLETLDEILGVDDEESPGLVDLVDDEESPGLVDLVDDEASPGLDVDPDFQPFEVSSQPLTFDDQASSTVLFSHADDGYCTGNSENTMSPGEVTSIYIINDVASVT